VRVQRDGFEGWREGDRRERAREIGGREIGSHMRLMKGAAEMYMVKM
jgi:hypothetical protein